MPSTTLHSTTTSANTDPMAQSGYSIYFDRLAGCWFGEEWSRVTCLHIETTCLTGRMTEAEARAWLAGVAA
jgi:hypothetical protein